MLAGIEGGERVIAGAYVDGRGGACPMLLAHRRGARTDFLSFAKAWDRFTRVDGGAPRPATERETAILASQLRGSLGSDAGLDLGQAIREHRSLRGRRGEREREAIARQSDPCGRVLAGRLRRLRRRRDGSLRTPVAAGP